MYNKNVVSCYIVHSNTIKGLIPIPRESQINIMNIHYIARKTWTISEECRMENNRCCLKTLLETYLKTLGFMKTKYIWKCKLSRMG